MHDLCIVLGRERNAHLEDDRDESSQETRGKNQQLEIIRTKGELLNRAFQINLMDPVLVRKVISYKNISNYLEFETRAERDVRGRRTKAVSSKRKGGIEIRWMDI